jgi:hypothetical protein
MALRKQLQIDTIFSTRIRKAEYVSRLKHKFALYFDCLQSGLSKAIAMQFAGFESIKEFERAEIHFDRDEYWSEN